MAIKCLGFAMLVLVAGTLVLGISAQLLECKGDVVAIIRECERFVKKDGPMIPPSKQCCVALEGADIPCFCKFLPPRIDPYISFQKFIYVATTCGCKIPSPGSKCGGYTVPHLPSPPVGEPSPPPKA